jgi:hypothetical protein
VCIRTNRGAQGSGEGSIEIGCQLHRGGSCGRRQRAHHEPTAGGQDGEASCDQVTQLPADPVTHNRAADRPRDNESGAGSHATSFSDSKMDDEPGSRRASTQTHRGAEVRTPPQSGRSPKHGNPVSWRRQADRP